MTETVITPTIHITDQRGTSASEAFRAELMDTTGCVCGLGYGRTADKATDAALNAFRENQQTDHH